MKRLIAVGALAGALLAGPLPAASASGIVDTETCPTGTAVSS